MHPDRCAEANREKTVFNYNSSRVRNPKLLAIVAGITGLLVLALGVWLWQQDAGFRANALPATGKVVAMKTDDSGREPSYRPMFEFTDNQGVVQRVPAARQDPQYRFARDELVPILYVPGNLDKVLVNNGQQPDGYGPTIMLGSLIFFVPALLAFLVHRRRQAVAPARVFLPEDEAFDDKLRRTMMGYGGWFLENPLRMAKILGVLGILCMLAGVAVIRDTNAFMASAKPVMAMVTAQQSDSSGFRPTLMFTDADGVKRSAQTALSDSSYDFEIGQQVQVYANPDQPDTVRVVDGVGAGVFGYGLVLFSVILLGLTLYALGIHRTYQKERKRRKAAA